MKKCLFIILFFILSYQLLFANNNASRLPKLSVCKVSTIAEKFITEQGIDIKDKKMTQVLYITEKHYWFVTFSTGSLAMGEGGFDLIISDENPSEISIQPDI